MSDLLLEREERIRATFGPWGDWAVAAAREYCTRTGMPLEFLLGLMLQAGPASLEDFIERAAMAMPASAPSTRS